MPLAAASSASAPPDDSPSSDAEPPTASMSAARSSTSRAGEYGCVSPLFPRPRRSYVTTVKCEASSDATFLVLTGEPIDEPIAGYGPFVMNTRDEIMTAVGDLQQGRFGRLA